MAEAPLDLKLLLHLGKEVKLLELLLLDHLDCHLLPRVAFYGTIDLAKFPTAN